MLLVAVHAGKIHPYNKESGQKTKTKTFLSTEINDNGEEEQSHFTIASLQNNYDTHTLTDVNSLHDNEALLLLHLYKDIITVNIKAAAHVLYAENQ